MAVSAADGRGCKTRDRAAQIISCARNTKKGAGPSARFFLVPRGDVALRSNRKTSHWVREGLIAFCIVMLLNKRSAWWVSKDSEEYGV